MLEEDLRSIEGRGRALHLRLRNFRPAEDSYVVALGGPLPYMVRLREIAEQTALHEEALRTAWHELAGVDRDPASFSSAWTAAVEAWSFDEVNDLIDKHNRYYPAESRLPMDPRTRTFATVGGEDYRRPLLDAAWALERFPADRRAAVGG
jgi:hypothetical protein